MKSDVSQLTDLGERILQDAAAKCYTGTVADWPLDLKRLRSRVEHEGMSFLTITLPTFGQEFERCLDQGKVDSTSFSGWKKKRGLPVLLWGFLSLVFEQNGLLKEEPDVAAIEGIRQIAYAFKKILLPCTPERESKAIQSYLEIEHDLSSFAVPDSDYRNFGDVADLLWGNVFGGEVDYQLLVPKHGPGVTAEGIRGNTKYLCSIWHDRLQPYFPLDSTLQPNAGVEISDRVIVFLEGQEAPVMVMLVPKTLKSPRVIAKEPCCMQYTQQALSEYLVKALESHWLTSGHLNFKDQEVNQRLALAGSRSGKIATLDLSSASDRVPLVGVERMLAVNPDLLNGLLATRSTHAMLPDGNTIPLRKFASMGSATCFPIEAMYFYTVILTSMWESSGRPLTLRLLKELSRDVYIYGDDIIIPVDAVDGVLLTLAKFNCKVGTTKSFWTGKFRESCGVEAYDGEDVTPTYIRRMCPESTRDASEVISWTATSNLFYLRGYWRTAAYMRKRVESVVGRLPLILENSPGLGWVNYQQGYSVHRWNKIIQRYEVKTLIPTPVYDQDLLDDWPALMKFLLSSSRRGEKCSDAPSITKASGPFVDGVARYRTREDRLSARETDHLHRSARHLVVSTKKRWTTPY